MISDATPHDEDIILTSNVLAVCCACAGGVLGYLGFVALLDRGFYALILPGSLLGLAAGIVRNRSSIVAALCAVLAVVAGLLAEHRVSPFVADPSLGFFLEHVGDLPPLKLFLIACGGLIAFWVPFRRRNPQ